MLVILAQLISLFGRSSTNRHTRQPVISPSQGVIFRIRTWKAVLAIHGNQLPSPVGNTMPFLGSAFSQILKQFQGKPRGWSVRTRFVWFCQRHLCLEDIPYLSSRINNPLFSLTSAITGVDRYLCAVAHRIHLTVPKRPLLNPPPLPTCLVLHQTPLVMPPAHTT